MKKNLILIFVLIVTLNLAFAADSCIKENERLNSNSDFCCKGLYPVGKGVENGSSIEHYKVCYHQNFFQQYGTSTYLIILGLIFSMSGFLLIIYRTWWIENKLRYNKFVNKLIGFNHVANYQDNPLNKKIITILWIFGCICFIILGLILLLVGTTLIF